jgi:RNase P subunit RPR2
MDTKLTLPRLLPLAVAAALRVTGAAAAPAEPYTPAGECGKCHEAIQLFWSESQHARSATKPSFLESLRAALERASDKEAARRTCLSCHAPTALASGDWALERPVTREGVTCDFCHTVANVELNRRDHPFVLEPGPVKRGPLEYATATPGHQSAYSALHRSSPLLCAACHEHTNAHGVPVLSTYSEWKAGPHPEQGRTCQECHMPLVMGRTAKEGVDPAQRRVNLHRFQGGSVASRLATGLELRIDSVDAGGSTAAVQVAVVNRGAGHAVPGGLPSKSLVLAVGVDTGSSELVPRLERLYRRVLVDGQGREVATVAGQFLDAVSIAEDTRLKPGERRTERFTLPLPADWRAIVARLDYRDASDPQAPPRVTRVSEVRRERGR